MSSSAITGASLGLQAFGQARQSEANERAGREQRRFLGREAGRRRDSGLGRQIFGLLGLGGGSIQSPEELAAGITGIRRQGAAAGNQATQQAVMNRLGRSGVSGGSVQG